MSPMIIACLAVVVVLVVTVAIFLSRRNRNTQNGR